MSNQTAEGNRLIEIAREVNEIAESLKSNDRIVEKHELIRVCCLLVHVGETIRDGDEYEELLSEKERRKHDTKQRLTALKEKVEERTMDEGFMYTNEILNLIEEELQ